MFENYIKNISYEECSNTAIFTFGLNVDTDDVFFLPEGSSLISYESENGNLVESGNLELQLKKIIEDDTCTILFEGNGPFLISYRDTSSGLVYYDAIYIPCESGGEDCTDHGNCGCSNLRNDDVNISSKGEYGIFQNEHYLKNNFSKQYALQLDYDENTNEIVMSDERILYTGDGSVYNIPVENYKKKLLLTYLNFDKYTAKFIEQIVDSHLTNYDINEWRYQIGTSNCFYHNEDGCVTADEDFTNATIFVEYITGLGNYLAAQATWPVKYEKQINIEDNKPLIDGMYKTYFFLIPDLEDVLSTTGETLSFTNPTFFNINNDAGEEHVLIISNATITKDTNGYTITTGGTPTLYDFTLDGRAELIAEYSGSDIDLLKNMRYVPNSLVNSGFPDSYVGEDAHLVTYQLRDMIVESIKECTIPCENQSYDEWIALMQKKKAAKLHLCDNNITEAVRIMFTLTERCKSCG